MRLILRKNSQWKENEIRLLLSCLGERATCEGLADRHKLSSLALHGSLINSYAWVWGSSAEKNTRMLERTKGYNKNDSSLDNRVFEEK